MRQLRSAQVTQGVERAPARSLFYAMGYTKEELDRPLIGVVSAHSEIVPGHFNLDIRWCAWRQKLPDGSR